MRRPLLLLPWTALKVTGMLRTFFPYTKCIKFIFTSILTGDFVDVVNEGLSNLSVNSCASKNGFLKSMVGGLAPANLNGPFGWGGLPWPTSRHWYSIHIYITKVYLLLLVISPPIRNDFQRGNFAHSVHRPAPLLRQEIQSLLPAPDWPRERNHSTLQKPWVPSPSGLSRPIRPYRWGLTWSWRTDTS